MRTKKYPVKLSKSEQAELLSMINSGKHCATLVKRANILLQLDESTKKSKTQKEIAELCHCCISTVNKQSERYAHGGIKTAMEQGKRTGAPRRITGDGAVEARIIQLACSQPPQGYARWTLRLLEEKVVELEIVPAISDNTIGRLLKKRHSSLI